RPGRGRRVGAGAGDRATGRHRGPLVGRLPRAGRAGLRSDGGESARRGLSRWRGRPGTAPVRPIRTNHLDESRRVRAARAPGEQGGRGGGGGGGGGGRSAPVPTPGSDVRPGDKAASAASRSPASGPCLPCPAGRARLIVSGEAKIVLLAGGLGRPWRLSGDFVLHLAFRRLLFDHWPQGACVAQNTLRRGGVKSG